MKNRFCQCGTVKIVSYLDSFVVLPVGSEYLSARLCRTPWLEGWLPRAWAGQSCSGLRDLSSVLLP